jgi:tRNA-2-methylthio-N6-dimethylallyladenosine synthase
MRYLLETYGCQMNKAESSALEILLREHGWIPAGSVGEADLVLINTCSVRATAESRALGRIDHFAAAKRERAAAGRTVFSLVVTGCMAERLKRELRARKPAVDYVVGTYQKQAFGLVLDAVEQGRPVGEIEERPAFAFASSHHEPGSFRSFLPIMHGCDNFCSYCIVPYLRGRELSRDPASILSELDGLEEEGVRELTLLGQNVNSYSWRGQVPGGLSDGPEGRLDFPGLLRLISRHLRERGRNGLRWIRFLTSHPKDLSNELIDLLAEDPLYCKHVHLCVQSGSNRVLQSMNRKYSREEYLDLVDRMKSAIPGLSLSTDILVGFPGETEEDLELTLDLMRRVGFTYSFMYHFNPREGTPAASMPGRVSETVKRARLARVIELQKETTTALMRSRIGAVEEVLVEDLSKRATTEVLARNARDEMVVFKAPASQVGSFATVRITGISGNTYRAEETA